ncbi:MAG: hypothetical protein DRI86_10900 [Bacteroidetes bacterium]|nr:MAG: hypothetical protein DRI86_10900 [Bacteroidota bacterium]
MMKKTIYFLVLLILPISLIAQKADKIIKKPLLKREKSFGINFNSDGWGVGYRLGKAITYKNKKTWDINFSFIGDSKQERQLWISASSSAKSFFYGKLEYFYGLQIMRGRQKIIAEKPYWGGVEIRWFYYGGLNVGIGKPIYLYVFDQATNNSVVLEKYDPTKHEIEDIFGRGPYTKGLSELSIHPGLSFKLGLNVEFEAFQEKTKAFEAGIIVDTYAIPIQIMGLNEPEYFKIRLFLAFRFGSRYNK